MSIFVVGAYSQSEFQYFMKKDSVNQLKGLVRETPSDMGEEQVSGVKIGGFVNFPLALHSLHDLFSVHEQTKSNEVIYRKAKDNYGLGTVKNFFSSV